MNGEIFAEPIDYDYIEKEGKYIITVKFVVDVSGGLPPIDHLKIDPKYLPKKKAKIIVPQGFIDIYKYVCPFDIAPERKLQKMWMLFKSPKYPGMTRRDITRFCGFEYAYSTTFFEKLEEMNWIYSESIPPQGRGQPRTVWFLTDHANLEQSE